MRTPSGLGEQFLIGAGAGFVERNGFCGESIDEEFELIGVAIFENLEQIHLEIGVHHGGGIFVEESPDTAVGEDSPLQVGGSHLFVEFISGGIAGGAIFIFGGFVEVGGPGSEFADTAGTVKEVMCTTTADMGEESIGAVEKRVLDADVFAEGFVVAVGVAKNVKGTVYEEETNLSGRRIIIEMSMMAFKVLTKMLEFLCKFFTGKKVR